MDVNGRATDNLWIERFWKNIKYNSIFLKPCDTGHDQYEGDQTYIEYYQQKKHQGIGMKPNDAYYKSLIKMLQFTLKSINLASQFIYFND